MNKIKCENKMKKLDIWYDMHISNDGFYYSIYPNKDEYSFPLIGVHSLEVDTRGDFDKKPTMKTVWEYVWSSLEDDVEPEYCGCNDCLCEE